MGTVLGSIGTVLVLPFCPLLPIDSGCILKMTKTWVMQQGDYFLQMLKEKTIRYLYPSMQHHLLLAPAQLGTKAGIIGAALLPLVSLKDLKFDI